MSMTLVVRSNLLQEWTGGPDCDQAVLKLLEVLDQPLEMGVFVLDGGQAADEHSNAVDTLGRESLFDSLGHVVLPAGIQCIRKGKDHHSCVFQRGVEVALRQILLEFLHQQ